MSSEDGLDRELESMNERLREIQRRNEMSKLQTEISLLERELSTLETRNVTPRPRRFFQDYDRNMGNMFGAETPPLSTPKQSRKVEFGTPDQTEKPDRFVTHRRKPKQPATSTPKQDVSTQNTSVPAKNSSKLSGAKLKPATFDGTGNWLDYNAHFEACSTLNDWTYDEKGLYLAICLRGQAQGVFGNLSGNKNDYNELSKSLEERFAPPNQTELYRVQLRERRQKAAETLSELGQDIRRLTNMAYPTAPNDVRETLAKEQFMDALINSDMRIRVKQARPVNLNDAVRHAVELEAYNKAERKHIENQGFICSAYDDDKMSETHFNEGLKTLQKTVDQLAKSVKSLENSQHRYSHKPPTYSNSQHFQRPRFNTQKNENRKCFNCGSENHIIRNCPKLQDKSGDNKQSNNAIGSGLIADVKFNGLQSECIIDTGASLSIISLPLWNRLLEYSNNNTLVPYTNKVYTASNTALDVRGKTKVCVEIQGIKCVWNVVVANINIDAILGLDFLKAKKCQVDAVSDTLIIQGRKCKLKLSERIGCMSSFTYFRRSHMQIQKDKISEVPCSVGRCRSTQGKATHRKANKCVQTGGNEVFTGQIIDNVEESKASVNKRVITRRKPFVSKDDRSDVSKTSIKGSDVNGSLGKKQTRKSEKIKDHILQYVRKRYLCKICQRSFKKAKYLSRHRKLKHSARDEKYVLNVPIQEGVMKQAGSSFRKENNDRLTRNFEMCRFKVSKSKIL